MRWQLNNQVAVGGRHSLHSGRCHIDISFRLDAAGDLARLNVGRRGYLSYEDGRSERPLQLHRPLNSGQPGRASRTTRRARSKRLCPTLNCRLTNLTKKQPESRRWSESTSDREDRTPWPLVAGQWDSARRVAQGDFARPRVRLSIYTGTSTSSGSSSRKFWAIRATSNNHCWIAQRAT